MDPTSSIIKRLHCIQSAITMDGIMIFFIFSVRIGKKSKDGESKSQVIEAINRLICTSKSQNHSLKGKLF